jgi:hypothetical protein
VANSRTLLPDEPDFMDDHFHGLGKPPYSEQRGETGSGGVAGTIKAIVTGVPSAAGIAGSIAAARALTVPETTASGAVMPQDKGDGWHR